jgi:formylglycine-generating enzyme required for sulfatase activity
VAGKPFALNIGKHELKLIHADHQDLPLGEVLVDPGDEPLNLGQRSMKAKAARGFIEVSTEPPDAQVSYTALNHEGQEVPGLIPGDNGEVPVGSNWKIVATCKGNSQSKQVKVAEGLNQVRFELSISQRLTNNFGMQFVYIPPPEKPFEFGHVEKRLDFRKNNHPDSVHFSGFNSQFRFMERNALTPPALVVDGGRNSYPIKPVFYIPPTKVRVSMGFYVAENEVTLREWQKVMGSRPSFMKDIVPDDQPVTSVSRKEAYSFMRRAEQLEGLPMGTYRLLTDVEFDYIAKHGNAGIDHATLAETNRKRPGSATKMPVDTFGLHEIQGNVAELVEDYYSKDFHKKFYNQLDPVNFTYSNTGIARGCHYGISMKDHSLSFRMRVNENGRDPHVGFRVVRMRPSVDSESSGRLNTAAYSEHFNESDSDQNNDSKYTRNQIAGK